jgi:protease-4
MKPANTLRNALVTIANLLRSLRRKGLDYIVLPISGPYPELPPQRDPLPFPFNRLPLRPSATSLEDMRAVMEKIGGDPRVRTVVLRFDSLPAGPATLYSLRRMLLDLRDKDKRLIAWLPSADTWDYYLASACDEIILPPPGRLFVLGLRIETTFLKDTLELIGVKADIESIGEYKTSPDTFRRTTMTEPHREMMDAILDSYFDEIVTIIAKGRGLDPAQAREMIDRMPMLPGEALEAGLIDAVLYEDELAAHIHPPEKEGEKAAPLRTWHDAARWLRQPIRRNSRQVVGVVSVEGMIVPGRSRRAPIPLPLPITEAQAGAETIIQALRQAEADKHIAAVILHVDSPGGSALASDLICREVSRLRASKPVVALMGEYAASGGYYIAAPANRIVARPTTLTGSIGIWGGNMGETYVQFKALVAEGREMTEEQVEGIARGRVWSGTQAREIGLADELGDFETALALAKELAGFKSGQDVPAIQISPPRHMLMPQPFSAPGEAWTELLDVLRGLARERVWAMAPWAVRVQDR